MNEVVLQTQSLTKHYNGLTAVDDLTLEVHQGEIFGLLGPNGAGKTTSIDMMCGLLAPDEGRVFIQGKAVHGGDVTLRARVGVCPQQAIFWEKLTCIEQLEFIGEMYSVPRKIARLRGDELLDILGLMDKRDELAATLSGGMQRRLNLALGLVHDPKILVLDEPEAGFDPQGRILVREYIRSLARQKTIILTTHNMDEAERMADRVASIDHGRLLVLDTPEAAVCQYVCKSSATLMSHYEFTQFSAHHPRGAQTHRRRGGCAGIGGQGDFRGAGGGGIAARAKQSQAG